MKKTKGFTLIEILLVVSIIGILSAIGISVINVPKVQQRSRDSRRIGDVKRIQTALELYFSDYRGYPVLTTFTKVTDTNVPDLLMYMNEFPLDPREGESDGTLTCRGTSKAYGYYYKTDAEGANYVIDVIMETVENANTSLCTELYNCTENVVYCNTNGPNCYCVQNPM